MTTKAEITKLKETILSTNSILQLLAEKTSEYESMHQLHKNTLTKLNLQEAKCRDMEKEKNSLKEDYDKYKALYIKSNQKCEELQESVNLNLLQSTNMRKEYDALHLQIKEWKSKALKYQSKLRKPHCEQKKIICDESLGPKKLETESKLKEIHEDVNLDFNSEPLPSFESINGVLEPTENHCTIESDLQSEQKLVKDLSVKNEELQNELSQIKIELECKTTKLSLTEEEVENVHKSNEKLKSKLEQYVSIAKQQDRVVGARDRLANQLKLNEEKNNKIIHELRKEIEELRHDLQIKENLIAHNEEVHVKDKCTVEKNIEINASDVLKLKKTLVEHHEAFLGFTKEEVEMEEDRTLHYLDHDEDSIIDGHIKRIFSKYNDLPKMITPITSPQKSLPKRILKVDSSVQTAELMITPIPSPKKSIANYISKVESSVQTDELMETDIFLPEELQKSTQTMRIKNKLLLKKNDKMSIKEAVRVLKQTKSDFTITRGRLIKYSSRNTFNRYRERKLTNRIVQKMLNVLESKNHIPKSTELINKNEELILQKLKSAQSDVDSVSSVNSRIKPCINYKFLESNDSGCVESDYDSELNYQVDNLHATMKLPYDLKHNENTVTAKDGQEINTSSNLNVPKTYLGKCNAFGSGRILDKPPEISYDRFNTFFKKVKKLKNQRQIQSGSKMQENDFNTHPRNNSTAKKAKLNLLKQNMCDLSKSMEKLVEESTSECNAFKINANSKTNLESCSESEINANSNAVPTQKVDNCLNKNSYSLDKSAEKSQLINLNDLEDCGKEILMKKDLQNVAQSDVNIEISNICEETSKVIKIDCHDTANFKVFRSNASESPNLINSKVNKLAAPFENYENASSNLECAIAENSNHSLSNEIFTEMLLNIRNERWRLLSPIESTNIVPESAPNSSVNTQDISMHELNLSRDCKDLNQTNNEESTNGNLCLEIPSKSRRTECEKINDTISTIHAITEQSNNGYLTSNQMDQEEDKKQKIYLRRSARMQKRQCRSRTSNPKVLVNNGDKIIHKNFIKQTPSSKTESEPAASNCSIKTDTQEFLDFSKESSIYKSKPLEDTEDKVGLQKRKRVSPVKQVRQGIKRSLECSELLLENGDSSKTCNKKINNLIPKQKQNENVRLNKDAQIKDIISNPGYIKLKSASVLQKVTNSDNLNHILLKQETVQSVLQPPIVDGNLKCAGNVKPISSLRRSRRLSLVNQDCKEEHPENSGFLLDNGEGSKTGDERISLLLLNQKQNEKLALGSDKAVKPKKCVWDLPEEKPTITKNEAWFLVKDIFRKLLFYKGEEFQVNLMISDLKKYEEADLIYFIFRSVIEDMAELEDVKPFEPRLTTFQKILIGLILRLTRESHPKLIENLLQYLEYYILFKSKSEEYLEKVTRFYTAICKSTKQPSRLRRTIFDAFYCSTNPAVFLYNALLSWIELLSVNTDAPDDKNALKDKPLIRVLLQVILTQKSVPFDAINSLKVLFTKYYKYPSERFNENELIKDLLEEYLCNSQEHVFYAILILCKNSQPKWVLKQLEFIKELFYVVQDKIVKTSLFKLIKYISLQFEGVIEHKNKACALIQSIINDSPDASLDKKNPK